MANKTGLIPGGVTIARKIEIAIYVLAFSYLIFLVAASFAYTHSGDKLRPYVYGDLLINYSCGFVRRGLIGSCFILLSRFLHLALTTVVNISTLLGYGLLLVLLLRRLFRDPLLLLILVFSPFGLLFFINNWSSVGRKELYLFLLFLFSLKYLKDTKPNRYFQLFLATFAILLHESFVFLFAPFIALAWQQKQQVNFRSHWQLIRSFPFLYLLFCVALLCLEIWISGMPATGRTTCIYQSVSSIANEDPNIYMPLVQYAISWLDKGLVYSLQSTAAIYLHAESAGYWLLRLVLLVLSLLLIAATRNLKRVSPGWEWVFPMVLLLGFLSQLLLAWDWGRFCHIMLINTLIFFTQPNWYIRRAGIPAKRQLLLGGVIIGSSFIMVQHIYFGGKQLRSFNSKMAELIYIKARKQA